MLGGSMDNSQLREVAPLWPKTNDDFLKRVDYFVRSNISNENFGATELSDKLGISVSNLNRVLKSSIGLSAGKLIRNTRMDLAYRLITESDIPVKNIGVHVGYLQQSNFTRAFINKYDKSPSSFRLKEVNEKYDHINWGAELSKQELNQVNGFLSNNRQVALGIEELCKQIENPDYKITEFASACCLSTSQLNRLFNKYLNITTSLFMRYLKISYVASGICSSTKDITQLIYAVNFFDTAYFNKCFKEIYGMTPSVYRKYNAERKMTCFFTEILSMLKNDKLMHS